MLLKKKCDQLDSPIDQNRNLLQQPRDKNIQILCVQEMRVVLKDDLHIQHTTTQRYTDENKQLNDQITDMKKRISEMNL